MVRVARVLLPCLLALLLGALSLAPPPARAESQPVSEKTYDAPPDLREVAIHLRDLFKQERYADIHSICEQGYAKAADDEAHAFFLHHHADAYVAQGSPQGVDMLRRLLDDYPHTMQAPLVMLDLADLDIERAQAAQHTSLKRELGRRAQEMLDRFLAAYPRHERRARALWKRGVSYQVRGDDETALKDYRRVVEEHLYSPWTRPVLLRAVDILAGSGRKDQAFELGAKYVQRLIAQAPRAGVAPSELTGAVRFSEPLVLYEALAALTPEGPEGGASSWLRGARYNLGEVLLALHRPAEALAVFERIIAEQAGSSKVLRAHYYAGYIQAVLLPAPESAIPHLEKVIAAETDREWLAWCHHRLGLCYLHLQDYPSAEGEFRKVLIAYPESAAAKYAQQALERTALRERTEGAGQ